MLATPYTYFSNLIYMSVAIQIFAVLGIHADPELCDLGEKQDILIACHRDAEDGAADVDGLTLQVVHCHNFDQYKTEEESPAIVK